MCEVRIAILGSAATGGDEVKRAKTYFERIGQAHAQLFPLIGKRCYTARGLGRLVSVFADRVEVVLEGSGAPLITVMQLDEIIDEAEEKEPEVFPAE